MHQNACHYWMHVCASWYGLLTHLCAFNKYKRFDSHKCLRIFVSVHRKLYQELYMYIRNSLTGGGGSFALS